MKRIIIVSDATGYTAERMVRATLLHYDDSAVDVRTHMRVRSTDEMQRIVERAAQERALIVYTIAATEAQERFEAIVARNGWRALDLIGGLMAEVGTYLGQSPRPAPDPQVISEECYRRIEAVKFMVKHDDGALPEELPRADLILVGVSRTNKTPLSMYLAQQGVRCANVPLVLNIPPPEELEECDQNRIIGLTIAVEQLRRFRRARLDQIGGSAQAYGTREHIAKELAYARDFFASHPSWPVVDVTNKSIEENAATILRIYRDRCASANQE